MYRHANHHRLIARSRKFARQKTKPRLSLEGNCSKHFNIHHPLLQQVVNKQRCIDWRSWQWDVAQFEILHPDSASATPKRASAKTTGTAEVFNPQQLMKSAKSIARDEARKTEHGIASQEERKHNTPAGLLAQYLKQPHEEI